MLQVFQVCQPILTEDNNIIYVDLEISSMKFWWHHFELGQFLRLGKSCLFPVLWDHWDLQIGLVQETSQSHYELVLNTLKDKSGIEQTLLGMKKALEDKDVEFSDLKSSLQSLKDSLEQLTTQQSEQHLQLREQLGNLQLPTLLAELRAFISAPRTPSRVKDDASQTSPDRLSTNRSPALQLNAPPGSKFVPIVSAFRGKENANKQQKSHIPTPGQDGDNNALCTCRSGAAAPEDGSGQGWLLTQELCQATPVRKVIKRNDQAKRLGAVRHAALNNVGMQTHAQNHEKPATANQVQGKSIGSRAKKGRSQKCNQRKRQHSSRKGGSKCTDTDPKQKETRKECAELERLPHSYRNLVNPANLSLVSQQKQRQTQKRKAEKSKLLLSSREDMQHVPNQREMSGVKKGMDISSTKNNAFWACSSPESYLFQNQLRWFNLSENLPPACTALAQEKTTTHCPLFFDSDFSD
uniref:Uncharacterized protein n=1 Tax=Sphaerodactylus townsendi TaxID=933632 RepID=A0ACB8EGW8_9SAUR